MSMARAMGVPRIKGWNKMLNEILYLILKYLFSPKESYALTADVTGERQLCIMHVVEECAHPHGSIVLSTSCMQVAWAIRHDFPRSAIVYIYTCLSVLWVPLWP